MRGLPAWRATLVSRLLKRGAVIAYPTEGVWGIGCLPGLPVSVARILQLKQRSWQEGLILVAASIEQVQPCFADLDAPQYQTLVDSWPGAITYLVPASNAVPHWITGRYETLAIRVSAHPVIRSICDKVGPIVSTSANISGQPATRSALQLRSRQRNGALPDIDHIVPGQVGSGRGASEIRDLVTGRVIRDAV